MTEYICSLCNQKYLSTEPQEPCPLCPDKDQEEPEETEPSVFRFPKAEHVLQAVSKPWKTYMVFVVGALLATFYSMKTVVFANLLTILILSYWLDWKEQKEKES